MTSEAVLYHVDPAQILHIYKEDGLIPQDAVVVSIIASEYGLEIFYMLDLEGEWIRVVAERFDER